MSGWISRVVNMTVSPDSRNEELINLIARCAIRDQAALKMLFDCSGAYLNAIVYRIVKSDDIAKEVLQEAFLQIWSNAQSYRPHLANPMTWMASIARYRALDRLEVEQRLRDCCASLGLVVLAWFDSPITGGDGNREFFIHAKKGLATIGEDKPLAAAPAIQRDVLNKLSKEILAGKVTVDSIILLDCFDGELVFRNQ